MDGMTGPPEGVPQISIEEAMAKIQCDEFNKLKQLFPELDFLEELTEKPYLAEYLQKQIQFEAAKQSDPLRNENAPKINEDFSNYFVINNMPKCEEKKAAKLKEIIIKASGKQNLSVKEENIDIPLDPETNQTFGVAFVKMNNEENARIGASIFDNFKLTKNNIFATCLLPEFDRIMQTSEELQMPQAAADLRDLRAPIFDVKRENYFYTRAKNVVINKFDKTQAMNGQPDEELVTLEGAAEKPVKWSPQGTYMISIKADKVVFLGGETMVPIITLPQAKVMDVKMSPCEQYVLTFSPMANVAFTVWNFKMVEVIRELPIGDYDDADSFKWSHDGLYLAKKYRTEIRKEGTDEVKVKVGITVYELPSMQILQNREGQKKSITLDGIRDWEWAPNRNTLIYSCFYGQDEEEDEYGVAPEEEKKQSSPVMDPRVGFMNIPSRQVIGFKDFNSKKLTFRVHPTNNYVGIINEYVKKGKQLYSVELFDLTSGDNVPHQQIYLHREILQFFDIYWEPNGRMLSILTQSKKESQSGLINLDAKRQGVDIYQVVHDSLKGFVIKEIGEHQADKVYDFSWSPAGEIFCTLEKDGPGMYAKSIWNWYLIEEQQPYLAAEGPKPTLGKQGKMVELKKVNKMAAEITTFEFKKTSRHEAVDQNPTGVWDKFGRFFVSYGRKGAGLFDKELRNIKFYSMFGQPLQTIEKIPQMSQFCFRPRPNDILSQKDLKALQKDYRKNYGKIYREEEINERKIVQCKVRDEKKVVRDEFLNNFFLPLRRKYEQNMEQYEALWPLKDKDMAAEEQTVDHVYHYGELQKTEKLVRNK